MASRPDCWYSSITPRIYVWDKRGKDESHMAIMLELPISIIRKQIGYVRQLEQQYGEAMLALLNCSTKFHPNTWATQMGIEVHRL